MANQTLMGWFDNAPRLRVARPGYNVLDAGLTGEQVAFDSSRQDTLRVFAAKFDTADTTRVNMTVNFGGNSVNRATAEYSFGQTLPFIPLVMAWTHQGNVHYPAYCYVYNDKIRIDYWGSQSTTKPNVSFIVFYNPMQQYRTEESAVTGIPRWCLGVHPTLGAGLHISRRGVNILSATALDLIFSTSFPMLQIDQAGRSNMLLQLMNSNPMQYDLTATVNLARARPDRPPVIAGVSSYGKNLTTISSFTMVTWTSDTSFIIRVGRWGANEYPDLPVTVDWALPKYDAAYPIGQSSLTPTPRWMFSGSGLKVSKANVDVRTASGDGLLFDPSLSMLNVQARGEIVRAGAENRLITVPVNTSGHPIVVYGNQVGGSVIGSMHGYLNGALPNPGGTPAAIASPALVYMESPTEMRYRASISSPYANIWWSALNFSKY